MDKKDIPFLTATELSGLIASREVSPVEAAEAYLDRIDDLDFRFNSYLTVTREEALRAARQAEQEIMQGNIRGPMHGVPIAVKDQVWTKGIRSTGGSRILADFVPDEDATVIAKLKDAGAVLLGKTNLSEFAITPFSHRFSLPRNPWNLDLSAGGPAAAQARPPPPSFAPPLWARTPAVPYAGRPHGAAWWVCGQPGGWSAATG